MKINPKIKKIKPIIIKIIYNEQKKKLEKKSKFQKFVLGLQH